MDEEEDDLYGENGTVREDEPVHDAPESDEEEDGEEEMDEDDSDDDSIEIVLERKDDDISPA